MSWRIGDRFTGIPGAVGLYASHCKGEERRGRIRLSKGPSSGGQQKLLLIGSMLVLTLSSRPINGASCERMRGRKSSLIVGYFWVFLSRFWMHRLVQLR